MPVELLEENEIISKMKDEMGEDLLGEKITRPRRIFIHISKNSLKRAVQYLCEESGFTHISTMTGVDREEEIEVIYHLNRDGKIELSLRARVPKDIPTLPTITDIIPGSVLYEREVHELLGIEFEGHPDPSPLLLPEGWPKDVFPLRKEWTNEKIKKELGGRL